MNYIKVNTDEGLNKIDIENPDWAELLRESTTGKPAVIRTPKGFRTVMKNAGYTQLKEVSPYMDLWLSLGSELPEKVLPILSAVFICDSSKVAKGFIEKRLSTVPVDTMVIQTTCLDTIAKLRSLRQEITTPTRVIVVLDNDELIKLNHNRHIALMNAMWEVEQIPVCTVDCVVVGKTAWTVNFKNTYRVSYALEDCYVCKGYYDQFRL